MRRSDRDRPVDPAQRQALARRRHAPPLDRRRHARRRAAVPTDYRRPRPRQARGRDRAPHHPRRLPEEPRPSEDPRAGYRLTLTPTGPPPKFHDDPDILAGTAPTDPGAPFSAPR